MGSFNATCGASGLPIVYGDEVQWFFIFRVPESFQHGLIDRNSRWHPLTLPIRGKYDSYGKIENIQEDALTRLQVEWLASKAQPLPENPRTEGDEYPHSLKGLVCAAERDEFSIQTHFGTAQVAPFMVHEGIYRVVIRAGLTPRSFGNSRLQGNVARYQIEDALWRDMKFFLSHIRGVGKSTMSEDEWEGKKDEVDLLCFTEEKHLARNLGLRRKELPEETWSAIERAFVQLRAFIRGMGRLRRTWHPQLNVGDQDAEYFVHQDFHRLVVDFAKSRRRLEEEWK